MKYNSRDVRHRIAKDFATAFIANKMDVTFRTAQNYTGNEIGDFWLLLADLAIKADNETLSECFGESSKELKPESDFEN